MRGSISMGRLWGIPFYISYTWFVIFAIVTASLVLGQFPRSYPGWSDATYVFVGIVTSLLFFASVVAHELAHGLVASSLGVPVISITLFIFGGIAQIGREAPRPQGELVIAAVGPFSSLALSALFGLVWIVARPFHDPTAAVAGWLSIINLSLAAFNLVPGFPLDGGRVLRSILWWITGSYNRATAIAVTIGQIIGYLIILGGMFIGVAHQAIFSGVWLVLIGWFLKGAAVSSRRQLAMRNYLQGYSAKDLMVTDYSTVPGDTTLRDLVEKYILSAPRSWFLVLNGNLLQGIISVGNVTKIPKKRWNITSVSEAMLPMDNGLNVPPWEGALETLERMDERGVDLAPVVESGVLLGVVVRDHLMELVRTKGELRL